MRNKFVQMSLLDTYHSVEERLEKDKPELSDFLTNTSTGTTSSRKHSSTPFTGVLAAIASMTLRAF